MAAIVGELEQACGRAYGIGDFIERVAGRLSRCVRYCDADVGCAWSHSIPPGKGKFPRGRPTPGSLI
jgi:hypothetical protein